MELGEQPIGNPDVQRGGLDRGPLPCSSVTDEPFAAAGAIPATGHEFYAGARPPKTTFGCSRPSRSDCAHVNFDMTPAVPTEAHAR